MLFIIAFLVLILIIEFQVNTKYGFNQADEGYLYLGTKMVSKGKVPISDFRAYDPGRYYLCSIGFKLLGKNIFSHKLTLTILRFISIALISTIIYFITESYIVPLVAILFLIFGEPRYFKNNELFFLISCIGINLTFISGQSDTLFMMAGAYTGIALFFGLNFALYAFVSHLFVILIFKDLSIYNSFYYFSGGVVGLLPNIYLSLKNKRYIAAYYKRKIAPIFERKSSNLPLPHPWLWQQKRYKNEVIEKVQHWYMSFIFTLMLPVSICTFLFAYTFESKFSNILLSLSLTSVIYFHYAYARSCIGHVLAISAPFNMQLLLLAHTYQSIVLWLITIVSLCFLAKISISRHWLKISKPRNELFSFLSNCDDEFFVSKNVLNLLNLLKEKLAIYNKDEVGFLPLMPMFYSLFDKEPIIYDTFCVYPATKQQQHQMLSDLLNIKFLCILNTPLDGKEQLKFSQTYPEVWHTINKHFTQTHIYKNYHIFERC